MKKVFLFIVLALTVLSCGNRFDVYPPEVDVHELYELKELLVAKIENSVIGSRDGEFPPESLDDLQAALVHLNEGISKARANAFVLQYEVDGYVLAANKALNRFDQSVIVSVPVGQKAELFVNGIDHKGWIDFGSSKDYCGAPEFTVETWVKYNEGFIETTFGSFISTFISPMPYQGWSLHFWGASNSLIRFCCGTDSSNPNLTLPTLYTGAPQTWGEWVHFAAVFSSSKDFMRLYVNGELKSSYPIKDNMLINTDNMTMQAFVEPLDRSRCMSGYMKNFRLWHKSLSTEEIKANMTSDVTGKEDGLICAWDFTVKPEDDSNILDKTGKHTAKLEGIYKWVALTE